MFEVRKDVPIPKAMSPKPPARRKYPFETMGVGGMFFVPHKAKNTMAPHASSVGRKLGRKFVTRLTHMLEGPKGWEPCAASDAGAVLGIGVWRTH